MSVIFVKTGDFDIDIDIDIMYINKQTRLLISLLSFALWSEVNRRAKKSLKIKGVNSEFGNQHLRTAGWTLTKRS